MKFFYFLIIMILCLAHLVYVLNSLNQIRYEELAESVRNVFWLQNRLIYDGISTNIAWPMILLPIYKLFGFSIFTAKFVRFFLQCISIIALAGILKKIFTERFAWIPLFTLGLSPILLYYSTIESQFGIDLIYLPICIYLLSKINFKKTKKAYIFQIFFWSFTMLAWMSYPTFIFYLPALGIFYIYTLFKNKNKISLLFFLKNLIVSSISFSLPLIFIYFYVQNREVLIFDTNTSSGIFRGAGVLHPDLKILLGNFKYLRENLFGKSFGYYFELKNVDFSSIYPIFSLILIAFLNIKVFFSDKKRRLIIFLLSFTLFFNLFIGGFTLDPTPGIRRYTPVLASLYGFFILAWWYLIKQKYNTRIKILTFGIILLVPLHHILVYPDNLIHIKDQSIFTLDDVWFRQAETPDKFLDQSLEKIKKEDLNLICKMDNQLVHCRYSEIYAAVAGSCLWNHLQCHSINAYDIKTKKFIPLSVNVWNSYYFDH